MKHVMFVDDEIQVLESLRDALRPHRREWRMAFAEDGPTALAEMERQPYDVVVSDMRMPGMDGARDSLGLGVAREHDAHRVGVAAVDVAEQRRAVHPGHPHVRDDDVVRLALHLRERCRPVLGERHPPLAPVPSQRVAQALEDLDLVVDEHDVEMPA